MMALLVVMAMVAQASIAHAERRTDRELLDVWHDLNRVCRGELPNPNGPFQHWSSILYICDVREDVSEKLTARGYCYDQSRGWSPCEP